MPEPALQSFNPAQALVAGAVAAARAACCVDVAVITAGFTAPREVIFDAVLERLPRRDSTAPLVVLVIEDVHWADEATLDLLRFVGRRLRDRRAMVIATYRDDALAPEHELRTAIGELTAQRSTRRIGLLPLSLPALTTLAAGTGMDPDALLELTGGNPYFAAEVLRTSLQLPPQAFSYQTSHGSLNISHVEFFRKLMNRLDDAGDRAAVVHTARVVYRLYGDLFHSLTAEVRHATR